MHQWLFRTLFLLWIVLLGSCQRDTINHNNKKTDLEAIKKRGKLIALTDYNSTSYFIYRGSPMGYQYELLLALSKKLEVDLEIIVSNDLDNAFKKLNELECDIVAINLAITQERKKQVTFTDPICFTKQVLVQKKPFNWEKMTDNAIENKLIRNQLDLAGKTVHIMKNSAFISRLQHLADEIGDSIRIVEVDDYEVEQLITLVDNGEIEYTVANEDVAQLNQTYFPAIDVQTAISFPQNQAWAVNGNNIELLKEVNAWIRTIYGSGFEAVIFNKYFKDMKATLRNESPYISLNGNKISEFDTYIKRYSKTINWDWRLLASLIYQESRFNSDCKAWSGAYGLMQLMPSTAKSFGASINSTPEASIRAGVQFISWIDTQLKADIKDDEERKKFILAAYNVGLGHVLDARRLAEANGKNPNVWTDNVDYFLLNKSNPKYYNPELVKSGYCRGIETYNYVKEVLARYDMYKKVIR